MAYLPVGESDIFADHVAKTGFCQEKRRIFDHIKVSDHDGGGHSGQRALASLPGHGSDRGAETIHAGRSGTGDKTCMVLVSHIAGNVMDSAGTNGNEDLCLSGKFSLQKGNAMLIGMEIFGV